jgi:hypothetical protein
LDEENFKKANRVQRSPRRHNARNAFSGKKVTGVARAAEDGFGKIAKYEDG